ncbi:MAG: S-adenosylmethionine:tRNA ribosyltransferase-isomerase, partial [Chloroflexota bacterium]
ITDYNYLLPESKIANFPLNQRDESKLLVLRDEEITDSQFKNLPSFIPSESFFVFNDTKVIKARLIFHKPEGARIEIFCLEEIESGSNYVIWNCYVGNSKKWKNTELILQDSISNFSIRAQRIGIDDDIQKIKFSWDDTQSSFEEMLELFGKVPLPPYIDREPVEEDKERYQTIYARYDGSVAAPTAGLHFTQFVLENLEAKKCKLDYVTLHVGAGTFKPVSSDDALKHPMHEEKVIIQKDTLLKLIQNLNNKVIAVGTTSMRTLESLYWAGYQIITGNNNALTETGMFFIDQFEPYRNQGNISTTEALTALYNYLRINNLKELTGITKIMIIPGYKFRVCNALITNFHQPQSTLLLLVAAFIGDKWKAVYEHALNNGYRFLSYGDSCLFFQKV